MADPKPSAEAMHVADTYAYCTDAVCTNGEWCHEMRTGLALALDAFATARVAEAVAAEREACARTVEKQYREHTARLDINATQTRNDCAAAIRARAKGAGT